jgi:uncharacterized membrane protein
VNAGQLKWFVRLLWLCALTYAAQAVVAKTPVDMMVGVGMAVGYVVAAQMFARRTR